MSGWCGLWSLLIVSGCGGGNGAGEVSVLFSNQDCPPGRSNSALRDFSFTADHLFTDRFGGVLLMHFLDHPVRIEETDGLAIRLELQQLLEQDTLRITGDSLGRAHPELPLVLPLGPSPSQAEASLSLFRQCPDFPTYHAVGGRLVFQAFTLAAKAEDTGRAERLSGTVTASLARGQGEPIDGYLQATFDFEPPRRPLNTFSD